MVWKSSWLGSLVAVALLSALSGCGADDAETSGISAGGAGGEGATGTGAFGGVPQLGDDCDPIVPSHCGYPFPSNVYLEEDATTDTGMRVAFGDTTLPKADVVETHTPPSVVAQSDGFSAGVTLLTHLPDATVTGLATPWSIEKSLVATSPTVLMDAETGEWVPHWAELDRTDFQDDERRAFMIRPAVRLKDATRYLVAIRGVVDADGNALEPTPAFAALRDDETFDHPSVGLRRDLYDDIFTRLQDGGVVREDLQLAWDFTTASRRNNTEWVLHMRDDALASITGDGPKYTIDSVEDDVNEHIARKLAGTLTVPLYLDKPSAGGRLVFGDDGLPKQNGTAEYGFTVLIPRSLADGTRSGHPVQFGHGLFGSRGQVEQSAREQFADEYGYVLYALNWVGMAEDDPVTIADFVIAGQMERFGQVPDRLSQALVNYVLATRMMKTNFVDDPNVTFGGKSAIDPAEAYYFGESQGGIMGCSYMGISPDISRGGLRVGGQPYSLLLSRSVDFGIYFTAMKLAYDNPMDQHLLIGLAQMLWDRTEPNGLCAYLGSDQPLPGAEKNRVLLHVAIGDHEVTPLGGHVMARTVDAKTIAPQTRKLFGIEEAKSGHAGNALVEFDFDQPPAPIENVPPSEGENTHGRIKGLPAAQRQLDTFFRTGKVEQYCSGRCDPE